MIYIVRKPIEGVIHLHLNQCKFHDKVSRIKDESLTTTTYVNTDKYIFKMKEHCYLDTDVRATDRYQPQSAVAYFKLEKVLRKYGEKFNMDIEKTAKELIK